MRILIATLYPNYGGSTKILLTSSRALEEDFDVELRGAMREASSHPDLSFPTRSLDTVWKKALVVPLMAFALFLEFRHVRTSKPDVIYVHDTPSLLTYGIIALCLGQKVVRHVHGVEQRSLMQRLRNALAFHNIYVAKFLIDQSTNVPWSHVSNCIEVPLVERISRDGIGRIYVAASISDNKNQILAVDVLSELRLRGHVASLHLCGPVHEPKYLDRLTRHIKTLGLERAVHFEGTRDIAEILERADVILCTSRSEAQPLIVLEALAAGVPVVAARIPATEEIAGMIGSPLKDMILAKFDAGSFADAIESIDFVLFEQSAPRVRTLFAFERFQRSLIEVFKTLS